MKKFSGKIKGVIFDMDGTIIDTEHIWQEALKQLLVNNGIAYDPITNPHPVFTETIGKGLEPSLELIRQAFNIAPDSNQLATQTKAIARELFKTDIQFIPGFQSFHARIIEALIPTSIATNCDPHSLEELSSKLAFKNYFGHNIYCVAHVNNKAKPDPAVFLHAAEKIGADPKECIVFEDSFAGFQAARKAGITCIGIKNNLNHEFIQNEVQGYIETYDDAEKVLEEIITKHW